MKYRKKPVVIDAVQWTGGNIDEVKALGIELDQDAHGLYISTLGGRLYISTLEGTMVAVPYDFIIKDVQGEFYPCNPDIFKQTYEPIEDEL